MSLINDMLRDLETRRPDDPARRGLQREVRALPGVDRQPGGFRLRRLGIGLAVLALGAGGWLVRDDISAALIDVPVPMTSPPAVPDTPLTAQASPPLTENLRLALELASVPPAPSVGRGEGGSEGRGDGVSGGVSASPAVLTPVTVTAPPVARVVAEEAPPSRIEKTAPLASRQDAVDEGVRRALALLAAGQGEAAEAVLREMLARDPAADAARQLLLKRLLESGQAPAAQTLLAEGLVVHPGHGAWAMALARLQLEGGDLAGADATLQASAAASRAMADQAGFHGYVKSRLGQHAEALRLYRQAVAQAPGEGRWWFGLGLAHEGLGQRQEMRTAMQRALELASLPRDLVAAAEARLRQGE